MPQGEFGNQPSEQPPGDYFYSPKKHSKRHDGRGMNPWIIVAAGLLIVVIFGWWFLKTNEKKRQGTPIEINNNQEEQSQRGYAIANEGDVSPISGLPCDNWNRRPIAVMQPSDKTARPMAGFSDADMVVEMPVLTNGKPRLMGVYICGDPLEVGSIRSSRHDFIHLAKSFDAIYAHWGGSVFALNIIDQQIINNIDDLNHGGHAGGKCFFRKEGVSGKVEDSGYAKFESLLDCAKEFGYRMENNFSGYPHINGIPFEERIEVGNLKVGLDSANGDYFVEYSYDKETNTYLRSWGGQPDVDRNNGKRLAPKNIVILIASQEAMEEDPHYNNVQLGDPWYDDIDSGEAFFYMNGKELRGKWRKDKSRVDSKLLLLNENGDDIEFVPGQIWIEVLEPGRALKWKTGDQI